MKRISPILIFLLLFFGLLFAEKSRGLWVVRYALKPPNSAGQIVAAARRLGISDLYVQVRASGKLFFSPETEGLSLTDNKAAANFLELVKKAHFNNIKIHAWLNVLNIWSSVQQPRLRSHLFYISRKSLLRRRNQDMPDSYKTMKKMGVDGYFLDPADHNNLETVKRIMGILLRRYNVDGIHLDYFRYPARNYTFCPTLRARFILTNYIDPQEIYNSELRRENWARFVYLDSAYTHFLCGNLTNLLANLQRYIKSVHPKAMLSVAVKPSPVQARVAYFQDWAAWLNNGLCDYVLTMNYLPDSAQFTTNLNQCAALGQDGKIVIGISAYNQDKTAVRQKIKLVRRSNFAGYALFSYHALVRRKLLGLLGLIRVKQVTEITSFREEQNLERHYFVSPVMNLSLAEFCRIESYGTTVK